MKIAVFHELDFGGAKRAVVEFSSRLKKNNVVDLYYVGEVREKEIENNFSNAFWYRFNPMVWRGNDWKARLYKDTVELARLYLLHRKIASDIKSKDYDWIFVHPSKFTQAPFLLRLLVKKCIYYCQEPLRIVYDPSVSSNIDGIKFPKNIYEFLNRRIRRWIDFENMRNVDFILANSEFSKNFIFKAYGKTATVCHLGVNEKMFKPLDLDKTIDVLYVGNKSDGYDFLKNISEVLGNKVGVKAIFRESGKLNVTDNELVEIYNKSKVLVALNHNEPFGLIPLEAMACGVPVVAVGEGGYNESIIDSKTGYLVSRDQRDLYDKISKIVNDEKLRKQLSDNARKHVLENWTWEKSVDRFLKIIKHSKYEN